MLRQAVRSAARGAWGRRWASGAPEGQKIVIFDTTLRDGEQSPGCTLNTIEKIQIARQLSRLGVDVCEAGFPIASDGDFEAVSRISEEVGSLTENRRDNSTMTIAGLSRATEKDIKRCHDAVKLAPRHRIHTFLATSDIHLKHKLQIDRAECIKRAVAAVSYAKGLCEDIEFSPEDAGRSDPDFLCEVLAAVIEAGATTLNIPDTVGYNTPSMYGELISYLHNNTRGIEKAILSTHCHNDLGMATANSLGGVLNGARQVEVTINGIGERAGNTSLEEIVMIIDTHKELGFYTNIDTTQIYRSSQLVTAFTGMAVQANKAVVGANAFAHESGIHQDGMLKNRETYEIMVPERVGVSQTSLVLGKHSGRNAFFTRLAALGYSGFSDQLMQDLFTRFKQVADAKKLVTEADIHALVSDTHSALGETELFVFNDFQIMAAGNNSTATVEIAKKDPKGDEVTVVKDAATGNGPVDAILSAINRIVGVEPVLTDYEVKSLKVQDVTTQASDAMGEVVVRVQENVDAQDRYHGRASDVNILKASGKAYLAAVNRMINDRTRVRDNRAVKAETP
eukprot:Hpha_TRINITY_DN12785_c0_g1::TRINITY_DN12785_c0_g1_i1::g.114390::m.114390/K01649/leuA, IMS; 2-isopropylmalate synthase